MALPEHFVLRVVQAIMKGLTNFERIFRSLRKLKNEGPGMYRDSNLPQAVHQMYWEAP